MNRKLKFDLFIGTLAAGSGICNSTLGGGIYCLGNFTGIASSGSACGLANSPAVYTQVSIWYIDNNTDHKLRNATRGRGEWVITLE